MGHVLAQRYLHPTAYRSKYHELAKWLAKYADYPDARRIYKLALRRKPKDHKRPRAPVVHKSSLSAPAAPEARPYRSTKRLSKSKRREAARIKRKIRRNVLNTRLTVTEKLLKDKKTLRLLDKVEIDQGYAKVAAAWFYYGRIDKALKLGRGRRPAFGPARSARPLDSGAGGMAPRASRASGPAFRAARPLRQGVRLERGGRRVLGRARPPAPASSGRDEPLARPRRQTSTHVLWPAVAARPRPAAPHRHSRPQADRPADRAARGRAGRRAGARAAAGRPTAPGGAGHQGRERLGRRADDPGVARAGRSGPDGGAVLPPRHPAERDRPCAGRQGCA